MWLHSAVWFCFVDDVTVSSALSGLQQDDKKSGTEARDKKKERRYLLLDELKSQVFRTSRSLLQDEFIAVRVQDPRIQNEESWYSYVDFKIFLHSNSKAFTAKTSCVRRRYSEFVWLKKKLQKNSGLVPVPELPPKTPFFSVSNDDFIEKRREGLQQFLEKVVNRTVFLSDSQLHLFLQTQLSPAQIEACVQGHAPCSVTTAILRYASSNQGWAQEEGGGAMQEDRERIHPLFYESPNSPAPHLQPSECESSSEISLVESDAHA